MKKSEVPVIAAGMSGALNDFEPMAGILCVIWCLGATNIREGKESGHETEVKLVRVAFSLQFRITRYHSDQQSAHFIRCGDDKSAIAGCYGSDTNAFIGGRFGWRGRFRAL